MKIAVYIGHPGHVHLFRNFAKIMIYKGHKIIFLARSKEFEIELLEHYKLSYYKLGYHKKNILGKIGYLILSILKTIVINSKYKADIFLSHGSISSAIVSKIFRKPHVSFEDALG